jgi:hypothetical protein
MKRTQFPIKFSMKIQLQKTLLVGFFLSVLLSIVLSIVFSFFGGSRALAGSWNYNRNGGFGIYQPLGWQIAQDGRSTELKGPSNDPENNPSGASVIFLASDWNNSVHELSDLRPIVLAEEGVEPEAISVSALQGYRVGDEHSGAYYLFREPTNFIVVRFQLQGSEAQVQEGKMSLSSIEIRTKANEEHSKK